MKLVGHLRATPTVVIDGLKLPFTPTAEGLVDMIRARKNGRSLAKWSSPDH
jgi:hypothetical protein